jgi:hypothetical protein
MERGRAACRILNLDAAQTMPFGTLELRAAFP